MDALACSSSNGYLMCSMITLLLTTVGSVSKAARWTSVFWCAQALLAEQHNLIQRPPRALSTHDRVFVHCGKIVSQRSQTIIAPSTLYPSQANVVIILTPSLPTSSLACPPQALPPPQKRPIVDKHHTPTFHPSRPQTPRGASPVPRKNVVYTKGSCERGKRTRLGLFC